MSKEANLEILELVCLCEGEDIRYFLEGESPTLCGGLDDSNGQILGCGEKILEPRIELRRPSVMVGYQQLCSLHVNRLSCHLMCTYCGIFCTQGNFMICEFRHTFHEKCSQRFSSDCQLKCPHCQSKSVEPCVISASSAVTTEYYGDPPIQIERDVLGDELEEENSDLAFATDLLRQASSIIDSGNIFGSDDLHQAIATNDLSAMAQIILSGFDLRTRVEAFSNGTCLHGAVMFRLDSMVSLVLSSLQRPDFINLVDETGKTALMCALTSNSFNIAKLLIRFDADLLLRGPNGMTVLHMAAQQGSYSMVEYILSWCKSRDPEESVICFINEEDDFGYSALFYAAERGVPDIMNLLIETGADPNKMDLHGRTVLHLASLANNYAAVKALLARNANPNLVDENDDTPLHIACRSSMRSVALLLMSYKADLMAKNFNNQMPLDCVGMQDIELMRPVFTSMKFLNEEERSKRRVICEDISRGKELFPISVVQLNSSFSVRECYPKNFNYSLQSVYYDIGCGFESLSDCVCKTSTSSYDEQGRLLSELSLGESIKITECSDQCDCNVLSCRNRVVQDGLRLPLEVFKCSAEVKGWGVRSLTEVLKRSFIYEYVGEYLETSQASERANHDYMLQITPAYVIDAQSVGNVSRFFNHSCDANMVLVEVCTTSHGGVPKLAFFAKRDINRFEELTFDYTKRTVGSIENQFICVCGSSNCIHSENTKVLPNVL